MRALSPEMYAKIEQHLLNVSDVLVATLTALPTSFTDIFQRASSTKEEQRK